MCTQLFIYKEVMQGVINIDTLYIFTGE